MYANWYKVQQWLYCISVRCVKKPVFDIGHVRYLSMMNSLRDMNK